MTVNSFRLSGMSAEQLDRSISAMIRAIESAPNGEVATVNEEIADFERIYEMSSDTLTQRLGRNQIKETAEINRWLMLLNLRQRLVTASKT